MSGSLRDYGGIDRQTIAQERQRIEEDRPPSLFLGLEDGEQAVFRILPARPGELLFHTFWKHTYTDPVTQKFVGFACPRRNPPGDLACPVCEQATILSARRNSQVDSDLGYALTAKKRVLVNVLLYEIVKPDGHSEARHEVLVWEFSSGSKGKSMHEELLGIADNTRAGGDFAHPLTGFPFTLTRTGSKKEDTTYRLTPLLGEKGPVVQGGDDEILAVLDRMHELSGMCLAPDAENLRQIVSAGQAPRGAVTQGRQVTTQRAQLPPTRPAAPAAPPARRPARTAADYMVQPDPPPRAEVLPRGQQAPEGTVDAHVDTDDWGLGDDDIPF